MENRELALYSYDAGGSGKNVLIAAVVVSSILTIISASVFSPWCLSALLLPVGIMIHMARAGYDKGLLIGNRYLILGSSIVYFANVSSARLDKTAQTLTLISDRGKKVVVCAEKFPTNARKADKIRLNKSTKFEKATGKIIARLREISPGVVIS